MFAKAMMLDCTGKLFIKCRLRMHESRKEMCQCNQNATKMLLMAYCCAEIEFLYLFVSAAGVGLGSWRACCGMRAFT
jgi:hypothetical protein